MDGDEEVDVPEVVTDTRGQANLPEGIETAFVIFNARSELNYLKVRQEQVTRCPKEREIEIERDI